MSIAERIVAGDVRATARLLRDIDDQIPSARDILKELYPHTGKAHVVGFTGSPGVGKSTLVDQIALRYRQDSLTVGILAVDEKAHRVLVNGREVHVSVMEMRLIVHLMRAPGRMCTRRKLLTEVWGYHPEVSSRTVDTHVKRLRDKLGEAADLLQTVRGIGFRLATPEGDEGNGKGHSGAGDLDSAGDGRRGHR